MATATIDAAAEEVGAVQGSAAILALAGTCTAGGIIVLVRPQGGSTYYPSAYISAAMIQQVPNVAGDGYGFVHGIQIPGGGHAKAVASADFAGSLATELLPCDPSMIAAGGSGLGVLGDSSAVPVAQSADADLTTLAARAVTATIALAASATTDGIEATVTMKDSAGVTVTGVQSFEMWISEAATGIGLTADSASGALTMVSTFGAIHTALTAKKHVRAVTNASGIAKFLLVDSANPTDQYFCVDVAGATVVSAASGTNWEGV